MHPGEVAKHYALTPSSLALDIAINMPIEIMSLFVPEEYRYTTLFLLRLPHSLRIIRIGEYFRWARTMGDYFKWGKDHG
ncbi:hypothetical protein NP493_872g01010 [Ridgeia piscesae]|uniref:Uncharacterized protein n=1 Tax=Ridgeia piscesae TaxID=27915 RepID=A0AAD9NKB9_RIDPI|nr:hypothetical protein NP493_872g01010 [Ridgeia piscesae]